MSTRRCQKKFQVVQSVISISPLLLRHFPQANTPCAGTRSRGAIVAPETTTDMKIVLASTSRYRRELLNRLQIRFSAVNPGVEETALAGEAPEAMATRLSTPQTPAGASNHPGALIIGCVQAAVSGGKNVIIFDPQLLRKLAEILGLHTSPDFGKLRSCNFPKSGDHGCQSEATCWFRFRRLIDCVKDMNLKGSARRVRRADPPAR